MSVSTIFLIYSALILKTSLAGFQFVDTIDEVNDSYSNSNYQDIKEPQNFDRLTREEQREQAYSNREHRHENHLDKEDFENEEHLTKDEPGGTNHRKMLSPWKRSPLKRWVPTEVRVNQIAQKLLLARIASRRGRNGKRAIVDYLPLSADREASSLQHDGLKQGIAERLSVGGQPVSGIGRSPVRVSDWVVTFEPGKNGRESVRVDTFEETATERNGVEGDGESFAGEKDAGLVDRNNGLDKTRRLFRYIRSPSVPRWKSRGREIAEDDMDAKSTSV